MRSRPARRRFSRSMRDLRPIPAKPHAEMKAKGMTKYAPVLVRSTSRNGDRGLEADGERPLRAAQDLSDLPLVGPARPEDERRRPPGTRGLLHGHAGQMNPNSRYYLSFDAGFPNAFDRSLGRSGGDHGARLVLVARLLCHDGRKIGEIYAIARESLSGGQPGFQFQSYPFRMTPKNLAQHRLDQNIAFWRNLKEGSDYFEVTKDEPRVSVASGRYQFNVTDETVVAEVTRKARQLGRRFGYGLPFWFGEQLDAAPVELLVDGLRLERVELERFEHVDELHLPKLAARLRRLEQRRELLAGEDRLDLDGCYWIPLNRRLDVVPFW